AGSSLPLPGDPIGGVLTNRVTSTRALFWAQVYTSGTALTVCTQAGCDPGALTQVHFGARATPASETGITAGSGSRRERKPAGELRSRGAERKRVGRPPSAIPLARRGRRRLPCVMDPSRGTACRAPHERPADGRVKMTAPVDPSSPQAIPGWTAETVGMSLEILDR